MLSVLTCKSKWVSPRSRSVVVNQKSARYSLVH